MTGRQLYFFDNLEQLPDRGDITKEELAKHNKRDDCWCSFKGYVYDMTSYLDIHPGGPGTIMDFAGSDMGPGFMQKHKYLSENLFKKLKIGKLVTDEQNK